jgi:bifunctional DNA-binding transcriptional regulator/antitoxin component of YhaV-PrlF toxin-antitoxin module
MPIGTDHETKTAMDRIAAGLATKSDKIRALGGAGYARGDIARYLGIRYQHVRNVLVHAKAKENLGEAGDVPPRQEWAQVGPDGRVVIPAAYRRLLGIEDGGPILMLLEDGGVRLVGRDAAVRRAQELVARYVPQGVQLSDELIAERRAEAASEDAGGPSRS